MYAAALGPLVLCQDCLAVASYTEARHVGDEKCTCGGEFCGCASCNQDASRLQGGEVTKEQLAAECAVVPAYAVVPPVCIDGEDDELTF